VPDCFHRYKDDIHEHCTRQEKGTHTFNITFITLIHTDKEREGITTATVGYAPKIWEGINRATVRSLHQNYENKGMRTKNVKTLKLIYYCTSTKNRLTTNSCDNSRWAARAESALDRRPVLATISRLLQQQPRCLAQPMYKHILFYSYPKPLDSSLILPYPAVQ
jgi:hypothetical protein